MILRHNKNIRSNNTRVNRSILSKLNNIKRRVRSMLGILTNRLIRPRPSNFNNLQLFTSVLNLPEATMRLRGIIRRFLRLIKIMPLNGNISLRAFPGLLPCLYFRLIGVYKFIYLP